MPQHVGERLARDRQQAGAGVWRHAVAAHVELDRKGRGGRHVGHHLAHLHAEVDGVLPQRVDARPHGVQGLAQRGPHVGKVGLDARLAGVHHAQGLHLQRRAREEVAHVVVDLPGNARPLGKGGKLDLVLLAVHEVAVLGGKLQRAALQIVPGLAVGRGRPLRLGRTGREQAGHAAAQKAKRRRGSAPGHADADQKRTRRHGRCPPPPTPGALPGARDVVGRQGQVRPWPRDKRAAGQKCQRQEGAHALRHHLAQAGKRHGHAQPRDQGGVDRASHQQREADQKHDGLVQQSAHGPIVRLRPHAASDVCHDLATPRRDS